MIVFRLLTPDELVADDERPCQQAADRRRGTGATAAIVPCAALPGTENLVDFGQRLAVAWLGPVVDLDLDVPTALSADRAAPPPAVIDHVRHDGTVHAGVRAHTRGEPFTYKQPVEVP